MIRPKDCPKDDKARLWSCSCNKGVTPGSCDISPKTSLKASAVDADIQTIEGIAQGEQLTAVQQCFVEHGGAQCGICTPGMVLAAVQYMRDCENQAQPINDPDLRHALSGNLCRCTGYMKIFESVLEACKQEGLAV